MSGVQGGLEITSVVIEPWIATVHVPGPVGEHIFRVSARVLGAAARSTTRGEVKCILVDWLCMKHP